MVERVLGKDEVTSSILVVGSFSDPDGGPDAKDWAGVTQWLESRPSKPLVAGSNPVSRSSLAITRTKPERRRYGEREV